MIKLIALLFTISIASANIFPFLLPDEGSRFNHYLQTHLKNSQKKIVIVTPFLSYPSFEKSILRSISHGGNLTLVTSKPSGGVLRLIAYEGVTLYSYTPRPLNDTLILIDNSLVCHLSGSFNEKNLSDNVSNVWCSDEASLVLAAQKQIAVLIKRSKPYLQ